MRRGRFVSASPKKFPFLEKIVQQRDLKDVP